MRSVRKERSQVDEEELAERKASAIAIRTVVDLVGTLYRKGISQGTIARVMTQTVIEMFVRHELSKREFLDMVSKHWDDRELHDDEIRKEVERSRCENLN